jgi:hypothetical protein
VTGRGRKGGFAAFFVLRAALDGLGAEVADVPVWCARHSPDRSRKIFSPAPLPHARLNKSD